MEHVENGKIGNKYHLIFPRWYDILRQHYGNKRLKTSLKDPAHFPDPSLDSK